MKTHTSRLRRHLTYANVMASLAVFLAIGGVSYAATSINGNKIVKHSIGAGKLKNGTLTASQVKADGLTGSVIDESTLSLVPKAQVAVSAETAKSATSAETAKSATSATSAETAETAKTANTAGNAETLEGVTAEELEVSCQTGTELFGGMCWDENPRPAHLWVVAAVECGEAGGRLPTLSELIAYVVAKAGEQFPGDSAWTSDVDHVEGGAGIGIAADDSKVVSTPSGSHGYRCLFYRANS
jgi:hypothetical protein